VIDGFLARLAFQYVNRPEQERRVAFEAYPSRGDGREGSTMPRHACGKARPAGLLRQHLTRRISLLILGVVILVLSALVRFVQMRRSAC
jgi:hypothetical protein